MLQRGGKCREQGAGSIVVGGGQEDAGVQLRVSLSGDWCEGVLH